MTFKKILQEEFKNYIACLYGPTAPVYINPTSEELKDCSKFNNTSMIELSHTIKFIVDTIHKEVIVFPGYIIHDNVWVKILKYSGHAGVNHTDEFNTKIFCGEARYDMGKMRFIESDILSRNEEYIPEMLKNNWDFANTYFTKPIKETISSYKKNKSKVDFADKVTKLKASRNKK